MKTITLLAIALVTMIGLSHCSKECNHDTTEEVVDSISLSIVLKSKK